MLRAGVDEVIRWLTVKGSSGSADSWGSDRRLLPTLVRPARVGATRKGAASHNIPLACMLASSGASIPVGCAC
jgi:hypothetical protein